MRPIFSRRAAKTTSKLSDPFADFSSMILNWLLQKAQTHKFSFLASRQRLRIHTWIAPTNVSNKYRHTQLTKTVADPRWTSGKASTNAHPGRPSRGQVRP